MKLWLETAATSRTGFPYEPADRPDGSRCHGFFDVKRHPELIGKIPELRGVPELRALVQSVNQPAGAFLSIGCEHAFGPSETSAYASRLTSYCGVLFDVMAWNLDARNFEGLFRHFEEYVGKKADLPDTVGIQFEIGHTCFNHHGAKWGFHVAIWNYGYGASRAAARKAWARGIRLLDEFFVKENAGFVRPVYRNENFLSS